MPTRKTRPDTPQPLRIGVLGCANIARQFCRDVAGSPTARVDAVASRDAARAAAFAAEFGLVRHAASYEALLADPALDAVYIPLPNGLHAEWAIRALEQGKHVLCEKPLASSLADARQMFEAVRRHERFLLEAYPYWFQPETGTLLQLLRERAIGDVRWMQACAAFTLRNPDSNIRLVPDLGGGALFDIGSYPQPRAPGHGLRAAPRLGRGHLARQRRGHRLRRYAALCRRPARPGQRGDGRGLRAPRRHRRQPRHDRVRIPEPHG